MATSTEDVNQAYLRPFLLLISAAERHDTNEAVKVLEPYPHDFQLVVFMISLMSSPSNAAVMKGIIKSLYRDCNITTLETEFLMSDFGARMSQILVDAKSEKFPLLKAIRVGKATNVRRLLNKLPADNTIRLITDGPELSSLGIVTALKEVNDIMTEQPLTKITEWVLNIFGGILQIMSKFEHILRVFHSALYLAITGESLRIIEILSDFVYTHLSADNPITKQR